MSKDKLISEHIFAPSGGYCLYYPSKRAQFSKLGNIKQLLDDVEHDIMSYHNRGLCYLPKPISKGMYF